MSSELARVATEAWWAGVRAADPHALTLRALAQQPPPAGPVQVVAIGKAAPAMATAALQALGSRVRGGLVVAPDGAAEVPAPLGLHRAGHPTPDARGQRAALAVARLVAELGPSEVLLALISGGGSALLADPSPELGLGELQRQTAERMRSGEDIAALNAWRIAHSTLKGGRMGRLAAPARVHSLVLCDVPGQPELVASGPTAGTGELVEIGGLQQALDGARAALEASGWPVVALPPLTGEAAELGHQIGAVLARTTQRTAWLTGGECTVRLSGSGLGGRCQELALAASLQMGGCSAVLLAAGTDGRDGPTDAAGAWVDGHTASLPGGAQALQAHDSHPWLARAGRLVHSGPTGTNVGDLLIGLTPG